MNIGHYIFHFFISLSFFMLQKDVQATVHVIGDSHAAFSFSCSKRLMREEHFIFCCTHKEEEFCLPFAIYWICPITMHRVGREGLAKFNLKRFSVQENDTVIFVFGEIDVRCHIGKQRDIYKRDLNEIIETLVKNYFNTIVANKMLYDNLVCIVFNVIPPCNGVYNAEYPYYGSLEDRVIITRKLNAELQKAGRELNIPILDIYDIYCASEGVLNYALSDDFTHIHIGFEHNHFVKEKLLDLLLNSDLRDPIRDKPL